MYYFVWLAVIPVVLLAIGIAICVILAESRRGPDYWLAREIDNRSLTQRWEHPGYAGSLGYADELHHRAAVEHRPDLAAAAQAAERARWARVTPTADPGPLPIALGVPHTGEWDTMFVPRWAGQLEAEVRPLPPAAPAITVCPVCEARDDQPHREPCPFFTEETFIP